MRDEKKSDFMDVEIKISDLVLSCRLRQNNTAKKISKLLPLKSIVNTWGDEIYFNNNCSCAIWNKFSLV